MSDDLISLKDAIEVIASVDITDGTEPVFSGKQVIGLLEDLDTIIPQEPKSGQWVHRNDDFNDWLECSECGYGSEGEVRFGEGTNFCPHCGADMRDKT